MYPGLCGNFLWMEPNRTDCNVISIDLARNRQLKGFSQQFGIDYEETYAPVFKITSLRILLSIAATLDLELVQLDVKTAFLNGKLDTTISSNHRKDSAKALIQSGSFAKVYTV